VLTLKNQRILPGIILIGFGTYLFLQQLAIGFLLPLLTWPTLVIIFGVAFLAQGYSERVYESILPGVIMTGIGLHFHLAGKLAFWPNHTIGMFVLILSIGFFLRLQKVGTGAFAAVLFLILAFMLLFYDKMAAYLGFLQNGVSLIWKFWPVLIILVGLYFLFRKRK
jgi:hypothetical protein